MQNDELKMFIVDVLQRDMEQLDGLLELLNNEGCLGWRAFWPHAFTEGDIVPAVKQLVRDGMVTPLTYDDRSSELVTFQGDLDQHSLTSLWFKLTTKGRDAWAKWTPPSEPGDDDEQP